MAEPAISEALLDAVVVAEEALLDAVVVASEALLVASWEVEDGEDEDESRPREDFRD